MTVALLLRESDPPSVLGWGEIVARSRDESLLVLRVCEEDEDLFIEDIHDPDAAVPERTAVRLLLESLRHRFPAPVGPGEGTDDEPDGAVERSGDGDATVESEATITVSLRGVSTKRVPEATLEALGEQRMSLLLLPRPLESDGPVGRIFRDAPCMTVLLQPGPAKEPSPRRILVPTSTGPNARLALDLALDLAGPEGHVEALFVEPRIGGEAERVGRQILQRELKRTFSGEARNVHARVAIADDPADGIIAVAEEGQFDLILVGATEGLTSPRLRRRTLPDRVRKAIDDTGVGVVRAEIPLAYRLERGLIRFLRATVPQLSRTERVELVSKVQSSSYFNFDFVTLVSLSTLIAALGLIRNSSAVVIGAMLVAPLMTPLVGCGLALVHGNLVLIRNAMRAVGLGFLVCFAIGLLLGWFVPGIQSTEEMLGRGEPNVLDLIVAAASGLAAAYATARPGLSGALPGVAIAAALVPPTATSGIAVALGQWSLAAGAGLLFFTNIVAIILGAAISLYAVGLRGERPPEQRRLWLRPAVGTLLVILLALTVWLSYQLYASLPATKVPEGLRATIVERLNEDEIRLRSLRTEFRTGRTDDESRGLDLVLWVEGATAPSEERARELAVLASDEWGVPVRVKFRASLVVTGSAN